MTIQEEIREGAKDKLIEFLDGYGYGDLGIEDGVALFLNYLHFQGVAIVRYPKQGEDLTGCVIVAVEPLIKE